MGLMAWLLGLLGDEAVLSATGRAKELVAGSATERAIEKALRNTCHVVALELVDPARAEQAVVVLLEHLVGTAPRDLAAGSVLASLEASVLEAVCVLWTEATTFEGMEGTHAEAIGLTCTSDELAAILVDEFIRSLGLVSAASPVATLVALPGTERNRCQIANFRRPDHRRLPGLHPKCRRRGSTRGSRSTTMCRSSM